MAIETDELQRPRRRYRRGDDLAKLPCTSVRFRPEIGAALERRAASTGRTKNEIVETAVARALGVAEPSRA